MREGVVNIVELLDCDADNIIELFCCGADYDLGPLRDKAVYFAAIHIGESQDPTIYSTLNSLLESEDLEGFVSVAARNFLPGISGWQHKSIN